MEICTILLSPNYFPLLVPSFLLNGQRGQMECKPQQLLSCPLAAQSHTVGREQQPALGLAGKSASITGRMSPAVDQNDSLTGRGGRKNSDAKDGYRRNDPTARAHSLQKSKVLQSKDGKQNFSFFPSLKESRTSSDL